MKNITSIPSEFANLTGKINYVQQVSKDEYSSSCPQCGGSPHKGGDFPDRFRMWTNARGKNKVMGWCRRCGYTWFPDNQRPIDKEEFERWRKEQIALEEERKRSAEKALELLKSQRVWDNYHAALNQYSRDVLEGWGIRGDWVNYWKLGLVPDYVIKGEEEYHTPAISIPLWQVDSKVPANIKLRMLNPKSSGDRYRSVYKMGKDFSFTAFPGMKSDTCLDPDAYAVEKNGISPMRRMVDILGKERLTYIRLPDKIDDMVVKYKMNLHDALRYQKEVI